jgi:hypothetical protein
MNLPRLYVFFGLIFLATIYFAANRSAFCILRKKEIPPDSAKTINRILSAAFFTIYLFTTLTIYFVLHPQPTEFLHTFLSQSEVLASAPSSPTLPTAEAEAPQGKIAAEQDRAERQRLIAEAGAQQSKAEEERRQLFGQELSYIIPEGISGTEDRYLPPKPEIEQPAAPSEAPPAETKISVQEMVSSSEGISSIFPDQDLPAAQIQVPPPTQQAIPIQPQTPVVQAAPSAPELVTENKGGPIPDQQPVTPPAMPIQPQPEKPVQQIQAPLSQPVQMQTSAQNVSCAEITMYMDDADSQIFHRAMKQGAGVATPWKGPGGSYIVIPASIKGNCREYSLQANIQGKSLRCYAACANIANTFPPISRAMPQQRNDKAAIMGSMSSTDQDAFMKALNYNGPVSWRGLNGIFYTVSPVRLGNPCREYNVQANIQGRIFQYLESNCQ